MLAASSTQSRALAPAAQPPSRGLGESSDTQTIEPHAPRSQPGGLFPGSANGDAGLTNRHAGSASGDAGSTYRDAGSADGSPDSRRHKFTHGSLPA